VPHLLRQGTSIYTVLSDGPVPTSHNGIRTRNLRTRNLRLIISELTAVRLALLTEGILNKCGVQGSGLRTEMRFRHFL
jgi:hypothetical protein